MMEIFCFSVFSMNSVGPSWGPCHRTTVFLTQVPIFTSMLNENIQSLKENQISFIAVSDGQITSSFSPNTAKIH